ncbi:MAG: Y-family DNA polymerase [Sphingobacterium sp.]
MAQIVSLWFPYLLTDKIVSQKPLLQGEAILLVSPQRGRMIVRTINAQAAAMGITVGMVLADARALYPFLKVFDFKEEQAAELLKEMAAWMIRYSPCVGIAADDGLWIDASGCTHLWKGKEAYLRAIILRFKDMGYQVHGAMAGSMGMAWAIARFGKPGTIINAQQHAAVLRELPSAALRLEPQVLDRMHKLGLREINDFIDMPSSALRRRFGVSLLQRLGQALGRTSERIIPVRPISPYQERLASLEPIRTRKGIEIALEQLLEKLNKRLYQENQGLRKAVLQIFRVDGKKQEIEIGTNRPSRDQKHLFSLFSEKITQLAPGLGIEQFLLEASHVESLQVQQEKLWQDTIGSENSEVSNLFDRISSHLGLQVIQRFLPTEHHWPERSIRSAISLTEHNTLPWQKVNLRPVYLLAEPERIEVSAPIPDYPPMVFTYKGQIHQVKKADGPERIEREWWIETGLQRDYYRVENQNGARYWIFRSGHYEEEKKPEWFMHGFYP